MTVASPDKTPPHEVGALRAVFGDHTVTLSYNAPSDVDFAFVEVTRFGPPGVGTSAQQRAAGTLVYRGRATRVVDAPLQNGVRYRYVVVTSDLAGNRSSGLTVAALPKSARLVSPKDGATIAAQTVFLWATVPGASYYNFQLYLGKQKVQSIWPGNNRFVLRRNWTFNSRHRTLVAGLYRWFVWPGYGPHAARHYGPLLGWATFVVS